MEGDSLGLFNSQSENAPTNPQNIDELKKIAKKKGSQMAPPFRDTIGDFRLERVSPVEKNVDPVTADARPAIGVVDACRTSFANSEVLRRLVGSIT
jgi:hypothetical protein